MSLTQEPLKSEKVLESIKEEDIQGLREVLSGTTPEEPETRYRCRTKIDGVVREREIICRVNWSDEEKPQMRGVIGKVEDVIEEQGTADC